MPLNPLLKGLKPVHPGAILREDVLPALGIPKAAVARRLGISRAMLYSILEEKAPVTPAMALRFGRLFGNSAEFWLNLQQNYDLKVLEAAMASELDAIEPVAA
ncbi:MAG: HigA family addiction module antidote protein [Bauldia sp.]|nr:HigA family addiction module antidote protein [Bauldia sp.]